MTKVGADQLVYIGRGSHFVFAHLEVSHRRMEKYLSFLLQLRLEDRERENASLTRQLENALTDIRRQQEQTRDKQAAKVG